MSIAAPLQRSTPKPDASATRYAGILVQRSCGCESPTAETEEKCDDCQAGALQAKLVVGATGNPLEREADEIADQIVSARGMHAPGPMGPRQTQRHTGEPPPSRSSVPSSVGRFLAEPGAPLEGDTRRTMEHHFGHDFSKVRVHCGSEAGRSARQVSARAYTVGQDIVFGAGQFAPQSGAGQRLLAHELTHVVQQCGSSIGAPAPNAAPSGALLRQATIGELPAPDEVDFDALADQVFEAIDGLGTDEEAVYQALQQVRRDPGMIATLALRYAQRHGSADLVADIEGDFSGSELEYALQLIGRGKVGAAQRVEGGVAATDLTTAAKRLRDAMGGIGTDEEAVYATLLPFNRATKQLETTFNFLYGETLRSEIVGEMSGSELKHALSLLSFEPESFLTEHFEEGQRAAARKVMNDILAVKGDRLDFADDAEFAVEVSKRLRTSDLMQDSQNNDAFDYPDSCTQTACPGACIGKGRQGELGYVPPNINVNAHVNKAARSYWAPAPTTSGLYMFILTAEGMKSPYRALTALFQPQSSICDKTLIHCDYLTTVIHLRAFAESISTDVFDKRVRSGAITMELSYWGFAHLVMPAAPGSSDAGYARGPQAVSLQSVRPASEADLLIGDHVMFWNHLAYDALTYSPKWSPPWRLENALLVDQDERGNDLYLGHGAPTNAQNQVMKGDKRAVLKAMVDAFNGPANEALAMARSVEHAELGAQTRLAQKFPRVVRPFSNGGWLVMELDDRAENQQRPQRSYPLKPLSGPEDPDLVGLRDPRDLSKMGWVKRPIESAPGRSPSQPKKP